MFQKFHTSNIFRFTYTLFGMRLYLRRRTVFVHNCQTLPPPSQALETSTAERANPRVQKLATVVRSHSE